MKIVRTSLAESSKESAEARQVRGVGSRNCHPHGVLVILRTPHGVLIILRTPHGVLVILRTAPSPAALPVFLPIRQ